MVKNYDNMLSRFHTIPACHRRADRQNCYINIARDKNLVDATSGITVGYISVTIMFLSSLVNFSKRTKV